jgi:hypothetical protein
MAKRNGKRRAWTSEHVRTLKALARKKTPAGKIARSLKRTGAQPGRKPLALDFLWNHASDSFKPRLNCGAF